MKDLVRIVGILVVAILATAQAKAAVLGSDTFTYSNGDLPTVSGGAWANFSGGTGVGDVQVVSGQAQTSGARSGDDGFTFAGTHTSDQVFAGFDVTVISWSPAASSAYFALLKDASTFNFFARAYVTNVTGGVQFGMTTGAIQPPIWSSPVALGSTNRIVISLDQTGATLASSLYLNGTLVGTTTATNNSGYSISQFALRQSNSSTMGNLTVDNLLISDTVSNLCLACEPVAANFTGSPTNGMEPLVVSFTDTSTGNIMNRFWDFGDGKTTNITSTSVVHTYAGGTYNVTLVVIGPDGISTNTRPNYITVLGDFQSWQLQYFGCTNCPEAEAGSDPDGDGQDNNAEFLAGTDPTSSDSVLRITAIAGQGNDVRVTWICEGDHSYVLQSTRSAAIASYTTNLADVSPVIVVSGVGETTTNYLDTGAGYAPTLTAPSGSIVSTDMPSTVYCSAASTRGLADSLGRAVRVGSQLMLGTFSISEDTVRSNFYAGNVSTIMSAFTLYSTPFTVGDGTGSPASWNVSRSAAGYGGRQIYLLAVDTPTLAAATHLGIFTTPFWVFPDDGSDIDIALEDVTNFVVGRQGGALTISVPLGQIYTFDDTARLSVLPGRILFYRVRLVPSLVAYYPFNGDANDTSGNRNNGIVSGATLTADRLGNVNKAYSFDGIDDFVSVPNSPSLSISSNAPITVALWAYRTGTIDTFHLLGKRIECGTTQYQMASDPVRGLQFSGDNLALPSTNVNQVSTGVQLPMNVWTHLVGTYDGDQFRFYINGNLAGTGSGTLGPANTEPVKIAASGSCAEFFGGSLDDVRVYNRALSEQEVQQLYESSVITP